jgi:hypothetical protein
MGQQFGALQYRQLLPPPLHGRCAGFYAFHGFGNRADEKVKKLITYSFRLKKSQTMFTINKINSWAALLAFLFLSSLPVSAQNSSDCSEKRLRKGYIITASKTVGGKTTTRRYQARTQKDFLMYLVELDAYGRDIKRIDAGGEPMPDGLFFRAELRQEMDYAYGSDNRLKLEQQLKMAMLFKYCAPWKIKLDY